MNLINNCSQSRCKRKKGFALILTLALISFVFLLVITLVNQVRMEFSFTDSRQNQILAKAHARMGMMIAIGEIQKHLGPDMRISTTADIYDERLESAVRYKDTSYPSPTILEDAVDLNENNDVDTVPFGQRMWTGVWKNRGGNSETELAYRPLPDNGDAGVGFPKSWDTDDGWDRHPAIEVAWLVSGNEGWSKKLGIFTGGSFVDEFIEVPDGVIIDDDGERTLNKALSGVYGNAPNAWADHNVVVTGKLNGYFHPLVDISKPSEDEDDIESTLILHAPVTKADGQYAAEPVRVPNTTVFSGTGDKTGKYAYWVGDEGVKSKFNIQEPIGLSDETKLKVASRPNFEVSGGFDDGGGSPKLINLGSHAKLSTGIIDNVNARNDLISTNFHNFTVDSFGVLSDLRIGGLKRDLSLAFALDENSEPWTEDFNNNFIFRDRVHCLKSLPLYDFQSNIAFKTDEGLKRNHWFDQAIDSPRGPLIDDKNALLAGPPWSVLADYHKLYKIYSKAYENTEGQDNNETVLEITVPDVFPRVTGDNALIFDRKGIKGSQGMTNEDARPFFNIFGGSMRGARPEPKNHPILPIITKLGVSLFPAVESNKFALAISPKISLWNPYDLPMRLDGLVAEIPFRKGIIEVGHFNLKEYDLFRKWWIQLYDNNATFPSYEKDQKKPNVPWSLFRKPSERYKKQFASLGASEWKIRTESGIIDYAWDLNRNEDFVEAEFNPLGPISKWGEPNGVLKYFHENIRNDVSYGGIFNFFSFVDELSFNMELPRLYLSLDEYILQPGEVALFTVGDFQKKAYFKDPDKQESEPATPLIRLKQGDLKNFFLLEYPDFTYSTEKFEQDYMVNYYIDFTGIQGFGHKNLEQISKGQFSEGYTYTKLVINNQDNKIRNPISDKLEDIDYEEYDSFTLYKNNLANPDSFSPKNAKILTRFTKTVGNTTTWHTNGKLAFTPAATTLDYLRESYSSGLTLEDGGTKKIPGIGWEWKANMPMSSTNERIILNDFNLRALVHSSQHGRGSFMQNSLKHFTPGFLVYTGGVNIKPEDFLRNIYFEGDKDYTRLDEDGNRLVFELEDPPETVIFTEANDLKKFDFMGGLPLTKRFPDFYDFDNNWIPSNYDASKEKDFNENPANIFSYDPDSRALEIGLLPKTDQDSPVEIIKDKNQNVLLLHTPVPKPLNADLRIGLFEDSSHRYELEIGDSLNDSSNAILFEVPTTAPLSILQYRHANLNNYLHGPSYALGNSYATTQVGRHRSWGRVDTRVQKVVKDDDDIPEAETWTNSVKTPKDMLELQKQMDIKGTADYGVEAWGKYKEKNNVPDPSETWTQSIDLDDSQSQFAPWRGYETDNSNHQNTTIDHSFYLNRALLDGYFLSGTTTPSDLLNENSVALGSRYRPAKEHHRLIAYYRDGDNWSEQRTSYSAHYPYASVKTESEREKMDLDYRYQSLAGDLFVDGAFNINSTSLDAWVTQLASLRGHPVSNAGLSLIKTPIVRFLSEPEMSNNWNELRTLSDEEIITLAKEMVRQVKLRGPFLDFADFVNRRLNPSPMDKDPSVTKGSRPILLQKKMSQWSNYQEDRESVKGLRGAVQAAIANAGLNNVEGKESWNISNSIPQWPKKRYETENNFGYLYSKFGFHAVSKDMKLNKTAQQNFGSGMEYQGTNVFQMPNVPVYGHAKLFDSTVKYKSNVFGEAPENLLAVEHVATGANKPGWVMQGDLLSPLAPVTSARSDTFTIRVMGEHDGQAASKSWIELVVQRTPDYVKPDLDGPHHRPHEPFKDLNLNGYWDDNENIGEQWIDLNRNGDLVKFPDLPGVGENGKGFDYRDGMKSDLILNIDKQEEGELKKGKISHKGINQRFGRKFKIIRFRWLRENEV